MDIRPRKRYSAPDYPSRDVVDREPELLRKTPHRWLGSAAVLTALTATAGIVALRWHTSRADAAPAVEARGVGGAGEADGKPIPSLVAPIFVHGEGRGTFGCVAVSPPVVLSEDEARQLIVEEAKKAGLEFVADATTVKDVPITKYGHDAEWRQTTEPAKIELALDGSDEKHRVHYEFVSGDDWRKLPNHPEIMATAWQEDIKTVATELRAGLEAAKPAGYTGVFYDPMETWQWPREGDYRTAMEEAKAKAREQLRLQVKDFVTWLKAQEVI